MRGLSDRYDRAVAGIDEANAADPTIVVVDGRPEPLALVHGRRAATWVARLLEPPGELVLLAARAHHLRRWEVPRASYPEGRPGYLRWRRDQKARHAREVAGLLERVGYGEGEIARVQALIRREGLGVDPEAQAVEDAACLVFLETQLGEVAARLEPGRRREVIRRTAEKMSPTALARVRELPLAEAQRAVLRDALGEGALDG